MNPNVKVVHRFGSVFLRLLWQTKDGRASTVARLTPDQADELAAVLRGCASGARARQAVKPKRK